MEFKEKIGQGLKGLNPIQQCQFAWLCGVRALPFLSVRRNFAYWPKTNIQNFLYSIFHALDVSASIAFLDDLVADAATFAATDAAAYIADAAAHAAAMAADAATDVTDAAAYAAYASYAAAHAAYAAAHAADAACTARAAYAADATDAAASYINTSDFKDHLLNDIEAIKKNKLDECNHDIGLYGKLWDSFQEDLKAIDCVYWAQFYERLFNNSFTIEKQQLKRHFGVPDEIKAEGAAVAGRYLERLSGKIEQLNEARIIILGEKGAGKTSLARRLLNIDTPMPNEFESTEGVVTSLWRFPGKDGADVNAHVWDFAGHSITHAVHRCFMSARCLYIYVYNGRIERDNDPAYWLEQIRIHGGDSPVLFLINEKDNHRADIAEKTLKDDYPSIVGYYRVDIGNDEDKTKLKEFRQTVMDTVSRNPSWNNQVVSMEAYKIKNKLREHFNKIKAPHIKRDEFDEIAKGCGASAERIEDILNDLNTLGICLWYNKAEMEDFNMLVLNPDWITNGIYRIINQSYNERTHILTTSKGKEILKNDKRYEYPQEKVAYLFKLMRLYELAFFNDIDNIFIPGILPVDRPDGLPVFDDPRDRLTMSFVVEKALPPSIAARIIVQHSDEIFDEKLLWRKGAVLKYKDSDTFARIIEENRSINICVKGTEKKAYIASLRETIKGIFDDYKVIKPDLEYEVFLPKDIEKSELSSQLESKKPKMVPEEDIIGYLQAKFPYLLDTRNKRRIPLDVLDKAAQKYGLHIEQLIIINDPSGNLQFGKKSIMDDHSITNNFNFHNCAINLQGDLNTLARSLRTGKQEPDDDAQELLLAAEEIEQVQKLTPKTGDEIPDEIKTEVKRKGLLKRLKDICDDLNDENSTLHKKASKIKRGIETAQKIAKQYNDIAQWFGLPQVPRPFLGNQ
jgi:GTPase SAR1 family protein